MEQRYIWVLPCTIKKGGLMDLVAYGAQDYIRVPYDTPIYPHPYYTDDGIEIVDKQDHLTPTEFAALPSGITAADFTDPISLEEPQEGEVYGFCVEGDNWFLAGSLKDFNSMIETRFKESNSSYIFVPFKNQKVKTADMKWVLL
jgi:hypothetical protein